MTILEVVDLISASKNLENFPAGGLFTTLDLLDFLILGFFMVYVFINVYGASFLLFINR
jgi:high-affinity nickel permease